MIHIIDSKKKLEEEDRRFENLLSDVNYDYTLINNSLTISFELFYIDRNTPPQFFKQELNIEQYSGKFIIISLIMDDHWIEVYNNNNIQYKKVRMFEYPIINFTCANIYDPGYMFKDPCSKRCAAVYITKDSKDIYIYPFCKFHSNKKEAEGFTYLEKDISGNNRCSLMESTCKEYGKYRQKWNIKKKILYPTVDISKSAAYLEAEVDLLYKIIGTIVSENNIDISQYKDILDAIEKHNVLNIKSPEKIASEIEEDKGNVRKRQNEYYEELYKEDL